MNGYIYHACTGVVHELCMHTRQHKLDSKVECNLKKKRAGRVLCPPSPMNGAPPPHTHKHTHTNTHTSAPVSVQCIQVTSLPRLIIKGCFLFLLLPLPLPRCCILLLPPPSPSTRLPPSPLPLWMSITSIMSAPQPSPAELWLPLLYIVMNLVNSIVKLR